LKSLDRHGTLSGAGYLHQSHLDEAVVIKACQSGARSAVKRRLSDKLPKRLTTSRNVSQIVVGDLR
jgi:hypothetical protein